MKAVTAVRSVTNMAAVAAFECKCKNTNALLLTQFLDIVFKPGRLTVIPNDFMRLPTLGLLIPVKNSNLYRRHPCEANFPQSRTADSFTYPLVPSPMAGLHPSPAFSPLPDACKCLFFFFLRSNRRTKSKAFFFSLSFLIFLAWEEAAQGALGERNVYRCITTYGRIIDKYITPRWRSLLSAFLLAVCCDLIRSSQRDASNIFDMLNVCFHVVPASVRCLLALNIFRLLSDKFYAFKRKLRFGCNVG